MDRLLPSPRSCAAVTHCNASSHCSNNHTVTSNNLSTIIGVTMGFAASSGSMLTNVDGLASAKVHIH
jgi:hypothetical protein